MVPAMELLAKSIIVFVHVYVEVVDIIKEAAAALRLCIPNNDIQATLNLLLVAECGFRISICNFSLSYRILGQVVH